LLKPGVHEFSYNLGLRRENFGRESADYDNPAALGFHRVGINRNLTLGASAEIDEEVSNIGGEAHFRVANFGQANVRLSASSADSQTGYAVSADYQFVSSSFNANVLVRTLSRDYANVSLQPAADKPRYELLTGMGLNSWNWGSWGASYSVRELHSGKRSNRTTVSWSKQMGRFGSLLARYSRVGGDLDDRQFFVGITRSIGFGRLAAVEYRRNKATSILSARISKNRSFGPGLGYNLNAGLEKGDPNALFSTEYGGTYGVYSASYRHVKGQNAFRIGATGSVSWIAGKTFFSRPIRNSFALVEVEDLRGVDVLFNNQFIGKTNKDGLLLAPDLNPYYGNLLSVNDRDIPVNYELSGVEQVVATPFRGGGMVTFVAQKLQAFTGILNISANGKKRPAEYWGMRYEIEDQHFETVVGKSGLFYLENIPAGVLPVEIFSAGRVCRVVLTIPQSTEMHIDLGETDCEITN
jgi:outer membrane usher protein